MGPDDALALLYLVSRPDLDVRAVAVSGTGLARFDAPVWFSAIATGATPTRSRLTWLVGAAAGDYALVVTGPRGPQVVTGFRAG